MRKCGICLIAVICGITVLASVAAYGQSSEVEKLASVLRMKAEAETRNPIPAWVTVVLGPLVALITGGFVALYVKRLDHLHDTKRAASEERIAKERAAWQEEVAQQRMLLEREIQGRQARDQLLLQKDIESRQWMNQKLMEKRLAVFDEFAPLLNDVYCFMMMVGLWKDITPPDALEKKRKLDRLIYVYEALFSEELRQAYFRFIHTCFETYTGPAEDAKILPYLDQERTLVHNWTPEWEPMFSSPEKRRVTQQWDDDWEAMLRNPAEHRRLLLTRYKNVMSQFGAAVGAQLTSAQPGAGEQGENTSRAAIA